MNESDGAVSCDKEKRSIPRRLLLILVLGLLVGLILIVTVNAYVAVKVDDTLADFDRGTFIYTGLLDNPEQNIHGVQLLPIGLSGDWGVSKQTLPEKLANLAAIANGDVIYVVGGTDIDLYARAEVYSSTITSLNGELTPWKEANPLPQVRAGSSLAVHRGQTSTLYVVGGEDSTLYAADTIYRATIDNNTGHVGSWVTDTVRLPDALVYASAVENDSALYVMGGYGGLGSNKAFTETYYATINPDGSLTSFVETSPLPTPLFNGYAVVYNGTQTDTLYFIGGRDNITSTYEVYFADFLTSGGLTDWKRSSGGSQPRGGALPYHLYGHSGVLINQGEILVTGGVANVLNISEGMPGTVRAALVDPTNPSLRLYDWCGKVPWPNCTIGAWQTGDLLPEVRAFHGTVQGRGYVYVIAGENDKELVTNTVLFGTVNGAGAVYAPKGEYQSAEIDLAQPATLYRLDWEATIGHPGEMGLTMQYRTSVDGEIWLPYSAPVASQNGSNRIVFGPDLTGIRYFQYQASFTTTLTDASPLLDNVRLYYEVPDPDVTVAKDTGSVITVALGSNLQYTIYYTNTGGWVAENVVLTETLPANTTYVGDPSWHRVDSSNLYTRSVGDVDRHDSGHTHFLVKVNPSVPPGTYFITNQVDIDYPAMIDAIGDVITDPVKVDNRDVISNPLALSGVAVTKEAVPPAGSLVSSGSFITYTIIYTNIGNTDATQVVLTDTYDPLGNYAIHSFSVPPDEGDNVWHLGDLPSRSHGQVEIVAQLNSPLPNHWPVTNQASLYSPGTGLLPPSIITHTVMNYLGGNPKPMVDLVITDIHWTPSVPRTGTWPRFDVTVVNTGTADAVQPFLIELYIKPQPSNPPEWPGDHNRGSCLDNCSTPRPHYLGYVSELAAGDSKVVSFTNLYLDPSPDFPMVSGIYDIYAQADVFDENGNFYWGSIAEDREDNNIRQESLAVSDLTVTKQAEPPAGDVVAPGSFITYTIIYTNMGNTDATQVVLTDTYDPLGNYTIHSFSVPPDQGDNVWHLGDLPQRSHGEIEIVAQLNSPLPNHWPVTNQASLYSLETGLLPASVITHTVMNYLGGNPEPMVDLVITDVRWTPSVPRTGTWPRFNVTLINKGTADDVEPFWIALYIKPHPSFPPEWPADHDRGYCLNSCATTRYHYLYYVSELAAKASKVVPFPYLAQDPSPDFPVVSGTYDIYAQADVAFQGDNWYWGSIAEDREDNNIWQGFVVVDPNGSVGVPPVYLPLVFKGTP